MSNDKLCLGAVQGLEGLKSLIKLTWYIST